MITMYFIGILCYMFCVFKLTDFIFYHTSSDLFGGFVFLFFTCLPLTLLLDSIT